MEYLQIAIQSPFVWGLLLGLMIAGFIWKAGFTARRHALGENKRLQGELLDLQGHLNTQLKINASGNETLSTELAALRTQNENLRVNLASLQQKPGKAELRQLQVHDTAIRTLREQAPGFAPAWEKAVRQAETEMEAGDKGLMKLVRRVIPSLGNASTGSQATTVVAEEQD
ncbi:MAG: hypothetical protein K9N23_17045 [Akkermansiaceae bacterium]|nr:hypothetical protein [Akkermansiaceae bacterium]MCF7733400.1 hypothetical protein [Akkermansiaceae bacterium]